jgi:starvation-inducible DNA-binding protein
MEDRMTNQKVTDGLNTLLADYQIYYQKLRNYHWNVRGSEFFKLHEKFEEAYNESADWVDDLAERILALGGEPYATLGEQLEHSRLDEDATAPPATDMVSNLVSDIESLNGYSRELAEVAEDANDRTTTNLLDDIVDAQEERLWMFKTFLQD